VARGPCAGASALLQELITQLVTANPIIKIALPFMLSPV
jgi:hypothetical protein